MILVDFKDIQTQIGFNVHKLVIWEDKNLKKLSAFGSFNKSSAPYIQTPYEGILISYKNVWKKLKMVKVQWRKKSLLS